MLKNIIKYKNLIGTKQLINLARNLKIDISDIKNVGKYRQKLQKRILENLK